MMNDELFFYKLDCLACSMHLLYTVVIYFSTRLLMNQLLNKIHQVPLLISSIKSHKVKNQLINKLMKSSQVSKPVQFPGLNPFTLLSIYE